MFAIDPTILRARRVLGCQPGAGCRSRRSSSGWRLRRRPAASPQSWSGSTFLRCAEAGIVTAGTTRFEIAEVAEVQAFPGMRRGVPAMFVAASALDDLGLSTRVRETWIRGERADILRTLDEAGTSYEETTTAAQVVDGVSFLTVSSTFGFMRSLGVAAALLVVGGVAVYFDARRRSRVLAYAFAASHGAHEAAASASAPGRGAGGRGRRLLAGVGRRRWSLRVSRTQRIDPLPSVRPDPLLRPATGLMLGLGLAALVVAWIAAAIAQRATDRDDPLEVLRAGT